jgi:hypothetical protein
MLEICRARVWGVWPRLILNSDHPHALDGPCPGRGGGHAAGQARPHDRQPSASWDAGAAAWSLAVNGCSVLSETWRSRGLLLGRSHCYCTSAHM